MEHISYKLDGFEGPLDLLLFLINKHKLDIADIPIFELVEQYIAAVEQMKEDDMEVASEFLEMAARLVYIKTVSLLPVHEEAQELKKELAAEIIGYRDIKSLAGKLAQKTQGFDYICRAAPEAFERDMSYKRLHEPSELIHAYTLAAGKKLRRLPPPVDSFKSIVGKKMISVNAKIDDIVARLKKTRRQSLRAYLLSSRSRSDLIAAFLAVLELTKNKTILITGSGEDADIELLEYKEMETI